jgi:RNA-binding protein
MPRRPERFRQENALNLSTKQIAYLRGLGQSLRPQLHLGHEGLTPGTQASLEELFKRRELVKVRILNTADENPKEAAAEMADAARAVLVGVIGKTFVLYRPNPELKERIELPPAGPATEATRSRPR